MRFLYRLHGHLVSRWFLRNGGDGAPSLPLRAVRLAIDFGEMGQMFGWRGVVDVVRDRLG